MDSRIDKEERAYLLLQWASLAPLAPFDQELAESGFYTAVQGQRSDQALDAWDKENPYEQSSELKAFHELERRGVITQSDFFSPDKAARCIRWIDPNDPSKGTNCTCKSYSDELKADNATRDKDHKVTDRRNGQGASQQQTRVQRTTVLDSDQGCIEVQGSSRRQGDRRSYRRGCKRTDQPNS